MFDGETFTPRFAEGVMPDGGARSATLERMSPLSPTQVTQVVRGAVPCADRFRFTAEMDTYELAV
jgi:hypothetical protein